MLKQLTKQLYKIVDLNYATAQRNIFLSARLLDDGKITISFQLVL